MAMIVSGRVAAGYEPVRDEFMRNFAERREVGAACAVVVDDELVVDLWGGWRDPKTRDPWTEDTMALVFSTTKGVSSAALAHGHSMGLFGYDDTVATHWPEFAQAGKERVTVRQLLSHQAGLCAIDMPMDLDTLADPDAVARAIAAQEPLWEPGQRHGYHGVSLGWYESELLRRVDPEGRTIGRYFAEEIASPLGLSFHIGLPDSISQDQVAVIQGQAYRMRMPLNVRKLPTAFVQSFLNPRSITARTFSNPAVLGIPQRYNNRDMQRIELPASNGIGTARSIAMLYGEMATGGRRLGLTRTTLDAFEQPAQSPSEGRFDQVLRTQTSFALGYCKPWLGFEFGSDLAYGTPGAGGSMGMADPALKLGFAYVMNRLDFHLWDDPRERALRDTASACARSGQEGKAARSAP